MSVNSFFLSALVGKIEKIFLEGKDGRPLPLNPSLPAASIIVLLIYLARAWPRCLSRSGVQVFTSINFNTPFNSCFTKANFFQ